MFRESFHIHAALQFDAAVSNQLRSTNIDVVSRPAPEILHEQNRVDVAIVEQESRLLEASVEIGIAFPDRVVNWDVELVQNLVR
jgi:hypothetical protein